MQSKPKLPSSRGLFSRNCPSSRALSYSPKKRWMVGWTSGFLGEASTCRDVFAGRGLGVMYIDTSGGEHSGVVAKLGTSGGEHSGVVVKPSS